MLDAPVDAWYVWVGLVVTGGVALGVAAGLPAAPPPDAAGAAETIDRTAASDHAAADEHPLPNADAVRVGADSVSLRGPGGVEHASLGYGPVTPADGRLRSVLEGTPPERVFPSPSAFEAALRAARDGPPEWRETDRLVVRRVTWGGVDATLVG